MNFLELETSFCLNRALEKPIVILENKLIN